MRTIPIKDTFAEKVCLTLPEKIVEDLKRIASFNDMELEKLVFSYITDGLAADARIAKRVEFTDKTNDVLSRYNVPPKSVEEIFTQLVE